MLGPGLNAALQPPLLEEPLLADPEGAGVDSSSTHTFTVSGGSAATG